MPLLCLSSGLGPSSSGGCVSPLVGIRSWGLWDMPRSGWIVGCHWPECNVTLHITHKSSLLHEFLWYHFYKYHSTSFKNSINTAESGFYGNDYSTSALCILINFCIQ